MTPAVKPDGRSARRRHTGTGIGDTAPLTWAAMRKAYEKGEPLTDIAKRFGVLYSAARSMAGRGRSSASWVQSEEARLAWEVRHGLRRPSPSPPSPARQDAIERRRAHLNAERLRWARGRASEVRAALPDTFKACRAALLAFCALPLSGVTAESCKTARDALSNLQYEVVDALEHFRGETARLARELGRDGDVIAFPRR